MVLLHFFSRRNNIPSLFSFYQVLDMLRHLPREQQIFTKKDRTESRGKGGHSAVSPQLISWGESVTLTRDSVKEGRSGLVGYAKMVYMSVWGKGGTVGI